jgi:hypothetical protein
MPQPHDVFGPLQIRESLRVVLHGGEEAGDGGLRRGNLVPVLALREGKDVQVLKDRE